jgi:hypothetical protein
MLPSRGFRYLLPIVSPYKTQTGGPVRANTEPYKFTTDLWIETPHLLCSWVSSQAHTFTHSHTAQYFHPAPWTWETWFHPKMWLLVCLCWELIRFSFCLLRQVWIPTWVLTNLMSRAPKLDPKPFWIPLCDWNSPPQITGREPSSPWINTSGGNWLGSPPGGPGMLSWQQGSENTTLWIPDKCPEIL